MIVLDTDIISILSARGTDDAYRNLAEHLARRRDDERVCATIISFEEQMRGWMSYIAASRTITRQVEGYARLHRLIRSYHLRDVLDFDAAAAGRFDHLRRARVKVASMDLKIAAIVLEHGATLVTRNTAHFKLVPELRVEDWTKPL